MPDPENIVHRRISKERQLVYAENPEHSVEDFPSSSSQEIPVENPDFTEENLEYYSDSPPKGSARTKYNPHPTPEAKEVKEVTEVAAVNHELFLSTP